MTALERATPEAVLVSESRPGHEGVGVASRLAGRQDIEVTLTTDAAFPGLLTDWDADALLVGADAIFADGRVRNKVGTRAAATVATSEGIHVYVVAAADKITPELTLPTEQRPAEDLTDDARLSVENPVFDVTPPSVIDAILTDRGVLDESLIEALADEHQRYRSWRR